jgi:hypothetical protein
MKKSKIIATSRENENREIGYFLHTFVTRTVLASASSSKFEWGPTRKQNIKRLQLHLWSLKSSKLQRFSQ